MPIYSFQHPFPQPHCQCHGHGHGHGLGHYSLSLILSSLSAMSMAKPPPAPTPTTEKPSLKNGSSSSSLSSLIGFGFAFAFLAFSIFSLLNNYYDSSISFNDRSHFSTVFSHFFFFPSSSPQLPITRSNNNPPREDDIKGFQQEKTVMNNDGFLSNKQVKQQTKEEWLDSIDHCNLYNGSWVRDDDSYPLYEAGSCPHIDEQFNCFLNGRPDNKFENFRWQPNGCNIPRLNGRELLELLRGKRLVYVGDSLNRNMWESMVCILRNSVEDKSKVFEASGKNDFRSAGSYSFIFADYNCSVEFFRSSFLVQEWEMAYTNGLKRATLRLDVMERSSDRYKSANVLIFNTGHWWTRGRTARGKGYFQEGSHIYSKLNLIEAFRKAMMTWARWIDANIDPVKTLVFFRGYSAAHFRGGQWNSGGKCDSESEPIKNATYLSEYPQKMRVLEGLMKGMKTPVFYLNITRMTDYRKDAHPSIYRKLNFTDEERRSPLRFQDCSHWCLPGVPDTWNELLYVQLLTRYIKEQQQQQH